MIPINLYQPNQFDFTVEFPTSWNELEQKEIIFIAKCLLTEPDPAAVRALLLKFIIENRASSPSPLGEGRGEVLPKDWFLYLDSEQVVIDCFPLLDFIFKENNLTNTPDPLTFKKIIYYPQPFTKITCAEYEDCEVKANQFSSKKVPDKDLLAEIAAILFRPSSPLSIRRGDGGEVSSPEHYTLFNTRTNYYYTYNSSQKVKYFKTLSLEELYGIFIWYACSRAQLPLDFPAVYEGGSSGSEPDIMAFTKCIHSGAGPKNGTRQQIRIMELYEFMLDMEQEAIHAKEMEAEYERIKNQP